MLVAASRRVPPEHKGSGTGQKDFDCIQAEDFQMALSHSLVPGEHKDLHILEVDTVQTVAFES